MYVIENLRFDTRTFLVIGRILIDQFSGKRIKDFIFFIDSSTQAETILIYYLKKFKLNVEKLHFDFYDLRENNKVSIFLRIQSLDLLRLRKLIIKNPIFQTVLNRAPISSYERYFIEKQITNERDLFTPGQSGHLYRIQYLLHVASWKAKSLGQKKVVLVLNNRTWKEEINNYATHQGVKIIWKGSFLNSRIIIFLRLLYRIIVRSFTVLRSNLYGRWINRSAKYRENTSIARHADGR